MLEVKLVIRDEKGQEVEVRQEYDGYLSGKSLDEIEAFISLVKRDLLPASEHALLQASQAEDIKKK